MNEPKVLVMRLVSDVKKRKMTDSEEEKTTPLQPAKKMGREDLADLLVQHGAREQAYRPADIVIIPAGRFFCLTCILFCLPAAKSAGIAAETLRIESG